EKANLASARKAYAFFNHHDKGLFDLMADDLVDHDQTLPGDVHGKAADAQHVAGFWQMSSNIKGDLPVMFAAGDYVVAIGRMTGTNDGDLPAMGIKKTGKAFKVDFIEVSRWDNGKATELWPFMDGMQLAAQLGLVPPPP